MGYQGWGCRSLQALLAEPDHTVALVITHPHGDDPYEHVWTDSVTELARREGIEALEIPRLDGNGVLKVTASLGVAALPDCGSSKQELIAAADAALYEAKHGGKNRTERAPARSPKTVSAD